MDARIYLSHAAGDAERVRPLRALLEALGMTVVTAWPEAIGSATRFVACFSAGGDGTTSYNRAEVEAAIERGQALAPHWIVLVQLTPCALPQLPGVAPNRPVVAWHGQSPEPAAQGTATFTLKAKEMAGEQATFTNVEGALSAGTSARTEIAADTIAMDGAIKFTNVARP